MFIMPQSRQLGLGTDVRRLTLIEAECSSLIILMQVIPTSAEVKFDVKPAGDDVESRLVQTFKASHPTPLTLETRLY